MNKFDPNHRIKTQPVTPEALLHIVDLASRDNEGLDERIVRYQRHASIWRVFMAVCIVTLFTSGISAAYNTPLPYKENMISGTFNATQARALVLATIKHNEIIQ